MCLSLTHTKQQKQNKMKTTLITVTKGYLESEILETLKAKNIGYNVYLSSKKLIDVQSYLYGNCGFSMRDIICAKLDKLTAETLNS